MSTSERDPREIELENQLLHNTIAEGEKQLTERNDRIQHLNNELRDRDDQIFDLRMKLAATREDYHNECGRCSEARGEKKHWAQSYKYVVQAAANLRAAAKNVVQAWTSAGQVSFEVGQQHVGTTIVLLDQEVQAYDGRSDQ